MSKGAALHIETYECPFWEIYDALEQLLPWPAEDPPAKIVLHPEAHLALLRDTRVAEPGSDEYLRLRSFRGHPCEIATPPDRELVVEEGWVVAQILYMDGPWVKRVYQVAVPKTEEVT